MADRLRVTCSRALADDVERELKELDPSADLSIDDHPRMAGIVDALSILASLSTIAASAFVVWADLQAKAGKEIRVERIDSPKSRMDEPDER